MTEPSALSRRRSLLRPRRCHLVCDDCGQVLPKPLTEASDKGDGQGEIDQRRLGQVEKSRLDQDQRERREESAEERLEQGSEKKRERRGMDPVETGKADHEAGSGEQ